MIKRIAEAGEFYRIPAVKLPPQRSPRVPGEGENPETIAALMIRQSMKILVTSVCLIFGAIASGCGSPNRANILLRKENQDLHARLGQLQKRQEADQRTIAGLENSRPTVPTLPATQLAQLFTTHGIGFGRLTGGADLDPNKPGDEGLGIYIVPLDQSGDKLKAAGTFDIDAFDLNEPGDNRVGHWHFDLAQSRQVWIDLLWEYDYALICPFTRLPHHPEITVKVTFLDELTQIPFTAQRVVTINLVPQVPTTTTAPAPQQAAVH
jgi:hypothetical protein